MPFGPLIFAQLYLYISSQTKKIGWTDSLHFLPSIIIVLIVLSKYTLLSIQEKIELIEQMQINGLTIWIKIIRFSIQFLIIPFYIYLMWRKIKSHEKLQLMQLSYSEGISINWLRRLLYSIFITWICLIVSHFIIIRSEFSYDQIQIYPFLLFSLALLYIGIYGIRNDVALTEINGIPENNKKKEPDKKQDINNVLEEKQILEYKQKLLDCIYSEKPYLNPKLSLRSLADISKIPYYHLSTILKIGLNTTFYDFINQYRVEEFIEKAKHPKNKKFTLLTLAFEAGFNSKSSFYSIFKKHKGISPSDFVKSKL
ncbi:AraC family transcriptional regulator [Aquimarina sp. AU119]|uniref:helix-turn-helix domain-containing protein n=1 Tax=Aquimarina sp. AU119 TaxID=2108528 RepID=UPI0013574420|nr:helix-turn-helix domain-containing protein [Aquimarina sp. AU119]